MKAMAEQRIEALVGQLAALLTGRKQTLALAESCTGGWVGKALTDLPGSSAWFTAGFVTYSNKAKQRLLGVRAPTLRTYGAVSAETAAEMAQGALERAGADWSVAVTGIAGPGGGSAEKPAGLVWFAWASASGPGPPRTESRIFSGGRCAVRGEAVAYALDGLLRHVSRDSAQ